MSASALSRMIRQDTARHPDQRLLPALRTGEVNGRLIRWFETSLPFDRERPRRQTGRFRVETVHNAGSSR